MSFSRYSECRHSGVSGQSCGARRDERLSGEWSDTFCCMNGFSSRSLTYVNVISHECLNTPIGQQSADHLRWSHKSKLIAEDADHAFAYLRGFLTSNPNNLTEFAGECWDGRIGQRLAAQLLSIAVESGGSV